MAMKISHQSLKLILVIITAYNFKERDLSNSKNTVKMTYKIFCI